MNYSVLHGGREPSHHVDDNRDYDNDARNPRRPDKRLLGFIANHIRLLR